MTNETEYGPEIVVDGVRLPWLRPGDEIKPVERGFGEWNGSVDPFTTEAIPWADLRAIRLPAQHPYYQVAAHNAKHGTQLKYWPGGDEAPGDWDGSPALSRSGGLNWMPVSWRQPWLQGAWEGSEGSDIIGYTPKPCAESDGKTRYADNMHVFGQIKSGFVQADAGAPQPGFVPCERTVMACIAALDDGQFPAYIYKGEIDAKLKALLSKPDPIAALVDQMLGDNKTPSQEYYLGMTRAASWLVSEGRLKLAQGEIRG